MRAVAVRLIYQPNASYRALDLSREHPLHRASDIAMKLIGLTASGFYGFEYNTSLGFVDDRAVCVGGKHMYVFILHLKLNNHHNIITCTANGSGKSNILRLVEFFLLNGTGNNEILHWEQDDAVWEPHKQCVASLHFSLTTKEQIAFAKWRVVSILSLLAREEGIKEYLLKLEEQDYEEISGPFSTAEIFPEDADDAYGIDNSPLFKKLRGRRMSSRRVKAFWEAMEKQLLDAYKVNSPYDSAIYYCHTLPRDTTSIVFMQVLCHSSNRAKIQSQLATAALNEENRVTIPPVDTLEDELNAIKSILCPLRDGTPKVNQFRGVVFDSLSSVAMWSTIEDHLRYGMPGTSVGVKPWSTRTLNGDNNSPRIKIGGNGRHEFDEMSLVNCAFTDPSVAPDSPNVVALSDVRSWCGRLILRTEKYMASRSPECQMQAVRGLTHIMRRLLLRSVCVLPQDRLQAVASKYQCVTLNNVLENVAKLMESSDRHDIAAVNRMQEAMKAISGQTIESHRYYDTGACVVGTSNSAGSGSTSSFRQSLKRIGGGYKELLMVIYALHGTGADSVLLDSPGFSLHPPQQKALSLWISKALVQSSRSPNCGLLPLSALVITNSTEFIAEDNIPCLYCFHQVVQSSIKSYTVIRNLPDKTTVPADYVHRVTVYDAPTTDSKVIKQINEGIEVHCKGGAYDFLRLADDTGYIQKSDLRFNPPEGVGLCDSNAQMESEMVIRVRPLRSEKLQTSDELKILDPDLKRLVFASGVFFFEGQSDYRVIEALKHVANGVSWEVVTMHGAGEVPKIIKIVDALNIPYGIVVDYDQIMPTINNKKHPDQAAMQLWRSSSIYKLISDYVHKRSPSSNVESTPSIKSTSKWISRKVKPDPTKALIGDLMEILGAFKQDQVGNQEIAAQVQVMTTNLKQYINRRDIVTALHKEPAGDKYARALNAIESIISETSMHPAIRAALVRRELRDIGIFTWNSDLEGMIFGYGEGLHDQQVVESMPKSMKDFCLENVEFLSGIAFERYSYQQVAPEKSHDAVANVDDFDRVAYLVETSHTGVISTRALSKMYRMVFGKRFQGDYKGIRYPFNVFMEKLGTTVPELKVTEIDAKTASALVSTNNELSLLDDEEGEQDDSGDFDDGSDGSGAYRGGPVPKISVTSSPAATSWQRAGAGGNVSNNNSNKGKSRTGAAPDARSNMPDEYKEYKIEWVGPTRNVDKDHPQRVFNDPAYWRFVGMVMHGAREHVGLWKRLPWSVLKDLIESSKNIRVSENRAGKYMTPDEIRKYGRVAANSPVHIGIKDLLDWMEEMQTRGVFQADVE
jgi:hypothetical protein